MMKACLLLSFEIKIKLFLSFNPRSLSCVGSSEPNQMLESYFVAGHLCLKILPLLILGASCCARTKRSIVRDIIIWSQKLQQFSNKYKCVGSFLCASFACCAIWLQPPSCTATEPPHECLQAVARTDWMKGNLLFTRKSPTCAITPKASRDWQLCSYL